jgi:hypothetical protein
MICVSGLHDMSHLRLAHYARSGSEFCLDCHMLAYALSQINRMWP